MKKLRFINVLYGLNKFIFQYTLISLISLQLTSIDAFANKNHYKSSREYFKTSYDHRIKLEATNKWRSTIKKETPSFKGSSHLSKPFTPILKARFTTVLLLGLILSAKIINGCNNISNAKHTNKASSSDKYNSESCQQSSGTVSRESTDQGLRSFINQTNYINDQLQTCSGSDSLLSVISSARGGSVEDVPSCVTEISPGTIVESPLLRIRPSQMSVGHEAVIAMFNISRSLSHDDFQKKLSGKPFPAVIAPNGTVFLSDGHHRVTVGILKDQLEIESQSSTGNLNQYKARLNITDNFVGRSWKTFGEHMVGSNKFYFTAESIKDLNSMLEKHYDNPQKQEQMWNDFINKNIPNNFTIFPDNPMRSLVGTALYELKITDGDFFKNFMEFRLSELIHAKLAKCVSGLQTKSCYSPVKSWSCSEINQLKEQVKDLIKTDKEVRSFLLENAKNGDCGDSSGRLKSCRLMIEEKLNT
ncbi:MAG: hypothetical protein HQK51_01530 [Oligoflexia bacterium]|nr:hypothetical protein [Oligoflexia bacterium]